MNNRTLPSELLTPTGNYHYSIHNNYSQAFRNFIRTVVPTVEFLGPPGEATNTSWSGLRRAIRSSIGAGIVGQLPPPMYICGTGNFDSLIHEQLCIRHVIKSWPKFHSRKKEAKKKRKSVYVFLFLPGGTRRLLLGHTSSHFLTDFQEVRFSRPARLWQLSEYWNSGRLLPRIRIQWLLTISDAVYPF